MSNLPAASRTVRVIIAGTLLYAADVATRTGLSIGRPRLLFQRPGPEGCTPFRCYDLSPDGLTYTFTLRPGYRFSPHYTNAEIPVSARPITRLWISLVPS